MHHQDLVVVAHILQITKGEHPVQQEMMVVMDLTPKVLVAVAAVLVVLVRMSPVVVNHLPLVMVV
jgi:hypothetical protein|tara:strand:+ start:238 stop:432 length:195 start_codon:yes stop_codon:yes gene_type:complete